MPIPHMDEEIFQVLSLNREDSCLIVDLGGDLKGMKVWFMNLLGKRSSLSTGN